MGGPSQQEFTPTETMLDPTLRPYVDTALSEAERLRQAGGPAYYSGDTYVKPSAQTEVALFLAQQRAGQGSPLLKGAQSTVQGLMGTQSPYESQYASKAGQTSQYGSTFDALGGQTSKYGTAFDTLAGQTSKYGSVFDQIGQAASPYQQQFANMAQEASPYQQQMAQMAQNAYVDPNQAFYNQMKSGAMQNEALGGTRATSQGAYLGGSPYLEGALGQANRLTAESLQEGIRGLQSKTSLAGRYGSGAEQQLAGKMTDAAARALAEQNQQAYLQNYQQERGLQEQALQSLGGLSQQGFVNQLTGAQGLGTAAQQAYANQMAATQGAQSIYGSDQANRMASLQAAQGVYGSDLANRMAAAQAGQNVYQQDYANQMGATQAGQGVYQQDYANQMAAAQAGQGVYQSDYANQMAALAGAQGVRGEDIATRMAAAGMAPGLAAADYADIDRLMAIGQTKEGYTAAQQAADKARYDYTANLPYQTLQNYGAFITGLPRGGITKEYVAPKTAAEQAAADANSGYSNNYGGYRAY